MSPPAYQSNHRASRSNGQQAHITLVVPAHHQHMTTDNDNIHHHQTAGPEEQEQQEQVLLKTKLATIPDLQSHTADRDNDHENQRPHNLSSNGKPTTKPTNKIRFLDGLRGLAVLFVVVHHSEYTMVLNLGSWGVDIFFVLSSFLLTMIFDKKAHQLVKNAANVWQWCIALVDYFQRRFLRVYPLFVCVALFLSCLTPQQRQDRFGVDIRVEWDLWKVLTFVQTHRFFVFWTLPLEIGYYFVIPVFVLAMMAFGKKWWWIPVAPVYFWIFYKTAYGYRTSFMLLVDHIQTFIAGSMSAIVYLRVHEMMQDHHFEFNKWHRLALRIVEYITFAWLLSTCYRSILFDWLFANPFPENNGDRFISLHVCILIVIEMLSPSGFSQCLEWSVLREWGKISFSVYLLHPFVIYNDWIRSQPVYDREFAQWLSIYVLATISHHLVEVPMQKAAGKISRFLASKEILEWPYQMVPKLTEHWPVLCSTRHEEKASEAEELNKC